MAVPSITNGIVAAGYRAGTQGPNGNVQSNPIAAPALAMFGFGYLDPRYLVGQSECGPWAGIYSAGEIVGVDAAVSVATTNNLATAQILAGAGSFVLTATTGSGTVVSTSITLPNNAQITPANSATSNKAFHAETPYAPLVVGLNVSPQTNLTVAVSSAASTVITVNGAPNFAIGMPFDIMVDNEMMSVTAGATTLQSGSSTSVALTVTRGINGTTAATHSIGANVVGGVGANGGGITAGFNAGFYCFHDPNKAVARAVQFLCAATESITFKVLGYNIFGATMSATVTGATLGATVKTAKCFKAVTAITATQATTSNVSAGWADDFDFGVFCRRFEDGDVMIASSQFTTTGGFTAPITTIATATTGAVRGKWVATTALTAAQRIRLAVRPPIYDALRATPMSGAYTATTGNLLQVSTLFGNTEA